MFVFVCAQAEIEQVSKRLEEAEKKRDNELGLRERVQQEFTKLLNENIEIKQRINEMHRVLDVVRPTCSHLHLHLIVLLCTF